MAANRRATFMVTLECLHSRVFTKPCPVIGEDVYCFKCAAYRPVLSAPSEYVVSCADCRYSHGYGAARLTAQYGADRHAERFPTHTVRIYNGRKLVEKRAPQAVQLELDSALPPPF